MSCLLSISCTVSSTVWKINKTNYFLFGSRTVYFRGLMFPNSITEHVFKCFLSYIFYQFDHWRVTGEEKQIV